MKTIKSLVLILAVMTVSISALNASNKTVQKNAKVQSNTDKSYTFKVDGACESCKTRIEKAANQVKGVTSAKWDEKTKMLTVKAKPEVNIDDVHKAVAKVGHDTDKFKADVKVYNALPKCCQYRK